MKVYVGNGSEQPIPNPVQTFEQAFQPYPAILKEIEKQGFQKPSPIQCQSWPILMQGLDMIGIAQTGTGNIVLTYKFILQTCLSICLIPVPKSSSQGMAMAEEFPFIPILTFPLCMF